MFFIVAWNIFVQPFYFFILFILFNERERKDIVVFPKGTAAIVQLIFLTILYWKNMKNDRKISKEHSLHIF